MRLIILLTVFLSFEAMAQSNFVLNLESGQVENRSTEAVTRDYPYSFRASNYFATRFEGSDEYYGIDSAQWPSRVTLEPVKADLETLRTGLLGSWRALFTCDGKPATSQDILHSSPDVLDHYRNEGIVFNFESKETMIQDYTASIESILLGGPDKSLRSAAFSYSVTEVSEGTFSLLFPQWNISYILQLVKIVETGEVLITFDSGHGLNTCPDGTRLKALLVHLDIQPTS